MKKWLVLLFILGLLTACGANSTGSESKETEASSEKTETNTESTETKEKTTAKEEVVESKYPFPSSEPTGEGKITVSTPAGDSSDGSAPVLFVSPDNVLVQIGLDLETFQGDKQTFIYIDKIFKNTEQVGELSQTSLDLDGNNLKVGEHTVTAVQFENDDPEGTVINFVEAKYEIKEKK
jgi:hypothetical protein